MPPTKFKVFIIKQTSSLVQVYSVEQEVILMRISIILGFIIISCEQIEFFDMSRHNKIGKLVSEGRQYDSDEGDGYSDNEQRDLSNQQWDMVDSLIAMFQLQESTAIKLLQAEDFDFDRTVDKIKKNRQKEKEKQEKKIKQKQQKQAKRKEKEKQQQLQREKQRQLELQNKKSKVEQLPHRKSSIDQPILNHRKSSYVVEEYHTDHYNTEYPSIQVAKDITPSNTINIVVVGHVDSGKSTLVGIFLKEASFLDKKQIHKNEKQSKEIGKQSFKHAWVTDSTEEERARGVTIDVGVKKIELGGKNIVFLDSPGHRDFIPNMITGAAQADYAILVIDTDNFESSFIGGGQTKEHAYIVKSLGVHKLIVAMNKMDRIQWSPQRFIAIKQKLQGYLIKIGFSEESIIFIPISAINAINITPKNIRKFTAQNITYNQSFIQLIASLEMPPRPIDKPFRMTITNIFQSQYGKLKGHCLSGKVEGGVLKKDEKLIILPLDTQVLVKEILINNEKVREAVVGDNIDLQVKLIDETAFEAIKPGFVLSSLKYTIPVTQKIVVEALALDFEFPVLRGTEVVIYIATNKSPARITKINFIYNPSDGTIIKKNPKMIKANDCAEIEIQLKEKMCAELFLNYKIFGRVIIREKKETLFVGTIKMIK